MPFTTGLITNTRHYGTAASIIVINARNLSLVHSASVLVQIFGTATSATLAPLYQTAFVVGANSFNISDFFIAGNVSYEVQLSAISLSPANVIFSVYGLDEFGNPVTNQRVLQSELTFIPSLTPIPT